ncbi:MAG: hypothetical protein OEL88_07170 [Sterolibacteriaceae bacterium MAG5]|nr:hypothetical protein [Candidatus Nitricoxidireducens bremensis]
MAQTLSGDPHPPHGRLDELADRIAGAKAAMPIAVALLALTLALFVYAARAYLSAECHTAMHEAELDTELVVIFREVDATLVSLRRGTGYTSKWKNPDFQDALKDARQILADGRHSLKDRNAYAALDSVIELQRTIATAKSLATNRVNYILEHQDPGDYDVYEKYRLEGKNLVAIVKELDSVLETLDGRTKKLPGACHW